MEGIPYFMLFHGDFSKKKIINLTGRHREVWMEQLDGIAHGFWFGESFF